MIDEDIVNEEDIEYDLDDILLDEDSEVPEWDDDMDILKELGY